MLAGKLGLGSRLQWKLLFASCLCKEKSFIIYRKWEWRDWERRNTRNFRGIFKRLKNFLSWSSCFQKGGYKHRYELSMRPCNILASEAALKAWWNQIMAPTTYSLQYWASFWPSQNFSFLSHKWGYLYLSNSVVVKVIWANSGKRLYSIQCIETVQQIVFITVFEKTSYLSALS